MKALLLLLISLALALPGLAQETPAPGAGGIREVSPGIYAIGALRIDQKERTVTFPAELNMTEGTLEYLLVRSDSFTHESLLATDVQPTDLHLAMLLLGAKGSGSPPEAGDAPPIQITKEYLAHAPKLAGDSVRITLRWKAGDQTREVPAEDWLFNEETKTPVARGPWIYNGSRFRSDHFTAQAEGSFAALVTNPSALINNPRKGNDSDLIWTVNAKAVPPAKTPVEISIQLEAPALPK